MDEFNYKCIAQKMPSIKQIQMKVLTEEVY